MAKTGTILATGVAFLGGMWANEKLDSDDVPSTFQEAEQAQWSENQASRFANLPEVYYANCSEARAHGAAPVYYDEPGYAPHLDRDRDGVGCE